MTRQTSLHGWTVPTEGDENYEDTFDDFFVDLDTNGEIRDVESNLQNYSPKSGAKFVATDTENRYIGDGSTWNKVASSGKNPNFDSVKTDEVTNESGLTTSQTPLKSQNPLIEDWNRQTLSYYSGPIGDYAFETNLSVFDVVLRSDAVGREDIFSPFEVRRGTKIRFYFKSDGYSNRHQWRFFLGTNPESIDDSIEFRHQVGESRIGKRDNGYSKLASRSTSLSSDTWYVCEFSLYQNKLVYDLLDLKNNTVLSIEAQDSPFKGPFYPHIMLRDDNSSAHTYAGPIYRRPL